MNVVTKEHLNTNYFALDANNKLLQNRFGLLNLNANTVCGFNGPHAYGGAYKNKWHKAYNTDSNNFYFEVIGSTDNFTGIKIKRDCIVECRYAQRNNDDDMSYGAISLNGNRVKLERRTNGIWSHSHNAAQRNTWSEGYYLGEVYKGEILSAGYSNSDAYWSNNGYAGFFTVKLIGLL
jgi:hypothetical protein